MFGAIGMGWRWLAGRWTIGGVRGGWIIGDVGRIGRSAVIVGGLVKRYTPINTRHVGMGGNGLPADNIQGTVSVVVRPKTFGRLVLV